jgi:hypothetical protein
MLYTIYFYCSVLGATIYTPLSSETSLPEDGRVRAKHVVKDSGVYIVAPKTEQ